jgi:trehalose/maltose transport system substrate-binding protein
MGGPLPWARPALFFDCMEIQRMKLLVNFCFLTLSCFAGFTLPLQAAEITITCGPGGSDVEFCLKHAQAWARQTGNTVRNFSPPGSFGEKIALYRQLFAAKSKDVDVLLVDGTWPGILKDHLTDLKPYSQGFEKRHFPAMVSNNTVNGQLLAMPWFTDSGLLYYRKDLLAK